MPTNPWDDIDRPVSSEEAWAALDGQPRQTSVAPAHELLTKSPRYQTGNDVKLNPPTATNYEGPFSDYGIKNNLKNSGQFWPSLLHAPMDMLDASLQAAGNFMPMGSAPNQRPPQDLTAGNFTRDMSAIPGPHSIIPNPLSMADTWKEASARGERGESTSNMVGPAMLPALAFGAAKFGGPLIGKAAESILPKDIAMEMANRSTRGAIGVKPKNFKHGATPDEVVGDLGTHRSHGRLLKSIQDTKSATFDMIDANLKDAPSKNLQLDPAESVVQPLQDAKSRAVGDEGTRIDEFAQLLDNRIKGMSAGSGKLNPLQLNQLRRWVDGFITTYKDSPTGTVRDLAQNVRSALRHQLDQAEPTVTQLNQRVQSYIEAENALSDKINRPMAPARTAIGELKNAIAPVVPDTLFRTGMASMLRRYAGQAPTGPLNAGGGIPTSLGKPSPFVLSGTKFTGFLPGEGAPIEGDVHTPADPRALVGDWEPGANRISEGGPDPRGGPIWAGQENAPPKAGNLDAIHQSIRPDLPDRYRSNVSPYDPTIPDLTSKDAIARGEAEAKAALEKPPRGSGGPTEPPLTEAQKGEAPATLTPEQMLQANLKSKPTHVAEGAQVSGQDEAGNLVSGKLEKIFPAIDKGGKPVWKGLILDARNSRTVEATMDTVFDRVKGPPKPAGKPAPKAEKPPGTTPASVFGGGPPENWPKPVQYTDISEKYLKGMEDYTKGKAWELTSGKLGARIFHDQDANTVYVDNIGEIDDVRAGVVSGGTTAPGGLNLLAEIADYAKRHNARLQADVLNTQLGQALKKIYPNAVTDLYDGAFRLDASPEDLQRQSTKSPTKPAPADRPPGTAPASVYGGGPPENWPKPKPSPKFRPGDSVKKTSSNTLHTTYDDPVWNEQIGEYGYRLSPGQDQPGPNYHVSGTMESNLQPTEHPIQPGILRPLQREGPVSQANFGRLEGVQLDRVLSQILGREGRWTNAMEGQPPDFIKGKKK